MNHDEILQAAKEAGIEFKPLPSDLYCEAWLEELERFAAIIEKRTIDRCAEKLLSIGALGDGDFLAAIRKLGEQ